MKLINLKLEFLEVFIMIINIVLVLIMDMDGSLNQKKNGFIILDKLVVLKALLTASRREENRRRTKLVDGFQKYKYNMNEDNTYLFLHFIHSELKCHCEALERMSKLFSEINKINPDTK